MDMMKERRKAPRADSNLPLDIYDSKGKVLVGEGRFTNVSMLGGLLVSRNSFKKSSAIRMHVIPADKPALDITGKVVWARKKTTGFEYGIRFSSNSLAPLS